MSGEMFNIVSTTRRELGQKLLEEVGRDAPNMPLLSRYIAAGAYLEETDAEGNTPLLRATLHDHTDAALLLIAAGADVHATDAKGNLPFTHADSRNNLTLMKEFIERDAAHRPGGEKDFSFISSEMWDQHMNNVRDKIAAAETMEAQRTHYPILRPYHFKKQA